MTTQIGRRRVLFSVVLVGVLVAGVTADAGADDRGDRGGIRSRTIVWDVAIDCRTFRFNGGMSFEAVGRGDTFIADGRIFPAGTLLSGFQANDPSDPGSIGHWVERGTMAATLAEIVSGARPAFFATWFHVLEDGSAVVAGGEHPYSGSMAIFGVTEGFSGAGGELADNIIGFNSTGCPNLRVTIQLEDKPRR